MGEDQDAAGARAPRRTQAPRRSCPRRSRARTRTAVPRLGPRAAPEAARPVVAPSRAPLPLALGLRGARSSSSSSSRSSSADSSSSSSASSLDPAALAVRQAVRALGLGDQRRQRARERVDLVCGEHGPVHELRLVVREQPLEAEHQRELLAPLDARAPRGRPRSPQGQHRTHAGVAVPGVSLRSRRNGSRVNCSTRSRSSGDGICRGPLGHLGHVGHSRLIREPDGLHADGGSNAHPLARRLGDTSIGRRQLRDSQDLRPPERGT